MAHTPGPWEITSSAGYTGHGVNARGKRVCSINSNSPLPHTERDANARLIAAAPELLAACQDCLEGRGDWGARMSAAVARAGGQ